MGRGPWAVGKPVLEDFAKLNALLGDINYTAARREKIAQLMIALGLEKSDTGPFVILRGNKGNLLKRPKTGGIEVTAMGRADWVGSLDLIESPVDEEAMRNTARVMVDVQADVLAVIEAESRPALLGFNTEIVKAMGGHLPLGRRVLVTSMKDPALSVLQEKPPESIRPLAISLLTSEAEGRSSLSSLSTKLHPRLESCARGSISRQSRTGNQLLLVQDR